MPRYYFHSDDVESCIDEEGMEFPDATAAKVQAVMAMGELLKDRASEFWDYRALKVIVTDQSGLILFVLDLSAVEAPAMRASRQGG